ncbi:MAG: T9SS type A sorting domain-containing protein [Saprospiraceae bacterium]|nr:T9SS type A sorting domain-containing protein [Saprospiraceae bacterium]
MTTKSYSQSAECPTVGDPPNSYYLINNNFQQSGPMYVKIYFHVFQNDDGSGGLTAAEIEQAKTILNNAYNVHNIYFIYDCNIDFIKNSFLYNNGLASAPVGNMVDEYEPNACITWNQNYKSDALNIYLVNPFGNPTGPRGMADGIPGTRCIIAGSTSGIKNALSSTLPHEVGHCLGLLHTYTGQRKNPKGLCPQINDYGYDCEANLILFPNTNAESSDQCNTTGDKICDTPPDYSEFGSHNTNCNLGAYYPSYPFSSFCSGITNCYPGIGFSSSDMVSIRTADCQIFNPNLTNFMTTASTTSCRTNFTAGQGAVMQNFINSHPALASVKRTADDYANAVNCPCSSEDIHIYNAQTYNTNQIIPGNIYVHAGGNLVITAQLGFTESKGIIVERGGKLWLTGPTAKLTAACNYKWWNGIEVEGNNAIAQPDDYQSATSASDAGIVYISNNATIEKAQIGISTVRHNERWNEAYWGGLVQVKDCKFLYNRKAIAFMRYRPGINGTNKSSIVNVDMDGTSANSSTTEGVTIWSSDGITYERNRLVNFDKMGLIIVDGYISVRNENLFKDSGRGVSCQATAPLNSAIKIGYKNSGIHRNYFTNTTTAIECYGANGLYSGQLEIYENEISGGNVGMNLQGDNDYKIGYNHLTNQTYGIASVNSGGYSNLTHCNTLQNNLYGLLYNGNNSLTQFKYNDLLESSGNEVLVFSLTNTPTELRNNQGIAGDPAENCFGTAEQTNQIATFGSTVHFDYYVPIDITMSCQIGGAIPFCNLSDGCQSPNNYSKIQTFNPYSKDQDCANLLNTAAVPYTYAQYIHFDSLAQYYQAACTNNPAACVQAKLYQSLREAAMRDVLRGYLSTNDWTSAQNLLISANFEAAKHTLYGLYFRNRDWSSALAVLNQLPSTNAEQRQFKATQLIAVEYAQAPQYFWLTGTKDSLLHAIANDEWPAAAHAKSLLYLIKGETFDFSVPILPRSSERKFAEQQSSDSAFKVYPNPVEHSLNIESTKSKVLIDEIQLSSLQGQIIKTLRVDAEKTMLDVSNMNAGMYLLKVQLADATTGVRIIQVIH